MAVQISGNDITVPRDGTFSRNVSIAGTLTYEDVTNVDSIGLVTARNGIEVGASPGVAASISVDGNAIFSGITTVATLRATTGIVTAFQGDIVIEDKIIHSGDTDTAIRFPGADQISFETGGTQHMIIGTGGAISITDTIQHTGDTNTKIRFPEVDHISFETAASEAMRIDNGGKLLIGLDDRRLFAPGHTSQLQIEGTSSTLNSSLSIVNNQDSNGSPNIRLGKTRGTSIGSNTSVTNGDNLGQIIFYGADGTDIYNATAMIGALVNGTVGTDTIPTDLIFQTSATTGSGRAERLRISSDGRLLVNTTAARNVGGSVSRLIEVESSGGGAGISVVRNQNTASPPTLDLG